MPTRGTPPGPGWLQAIPAGDERGVGRTSTVNLVRGRAVANTTIVPLGAEDSIDLTCVVAGDGSTHAVVDIVGWVTSPSAPTVAAGRFVPIRPDRIDDSRPGAALGDADTVALDASRATPPDARAAVWNVTVIARRPGWLRVWADGADEPITSSLNWSGAGEVRAGAVIGALAGGRSRARVDDGGADRTGPVAHVVADLFGYLT